VVSSLRRQLAPSIAGATAAAALGVLALVLAAVGTLGVFAYLVNERLGEIGLRRALGARARDILALLAARVSWPLGGGLAAGLIAALAMARVLAGFLHGISPYDPMAYAAVLCVLAGAALAAAVIPARRALRVDPAITLRHD
jgi:ABC-type antimicrobial peptide transport system permease subunit